MKRLEELYTDVLINEALRKFNLSDRDVRTLLDKAYAEVNQRNPNSKRQKRREGEESPLKPILLSLYNLQNDYKDIFLSFAKNPEQSLKAIIQKDKFWDGAGGANDHMQIWLRQGGKLVFGDILKNLGLNNYTVEQTVTGHPVYKFHLLHKYIQMNVLTDLVRAKKIDQDTKKNIEGIVFNEYTKRQFINEINNYYGQIASIRVELEEKEPLSTNLHPERDESETEVEVPKTPAEDRLELIKQRANAIRK